MNVNHILFSVLLNDKIGDLLKFNNIYNANVPDDIYNFFLDISKF
jgi:hypothetical protein